MAEQEILTEGLLFKRQRGRRSSDLQKLKFQERSCRLTASSFEYYKGRKVLQGMSYIFVLNVTITSE